MDISAYNTFPFCHSFTSWVFSTRISPLIFFLSPQVSSILIGKPDFALFVCLSFLSLVLDVTGQIAGTLLIIQQRSVIFSLIGLIRLITSLSLNILLIIILNMGLSGYFLSSVLTAILSSSVFHILAIKNCGVRFNRKIAGKVIRFQLPLMPSEFIGYLSRQTERILVRFMISLRAVGILEMGYKFPPLLGILITIPFFRTWHTKRTEIADQSEAPKEIGKMLTNYLFFMIFAGLLLSVNVKSLLEILTPAEFWDAYRISRIEIITFIFVGSSRHMVFGLYYKKRTKKIAFIISITSVVKIILSFLLIKNLGIMGAAYSACIIALVRLVWYHKESQKLYPIIIEYKKIIFMVCSAIGIFYFLNQIQYDDFFIAVFVKNHIISPFTTLLAKSFFGTWKSGKLIAIFISKQNQIIEGLFNSLFCLSFLITLPFIRSSFRMRLLGLCRQIFFSKSRSPRPN